MKALLKSVLPSALAVIAYLACSKSVLAAPCPQATVGLSKDAKAYVARFFDGVPFSGSVDATFYTASASYAATIPELDIAKSSKSGGFSSKTVSFANTVSDPIEGVALSFHGSDVGQACDQNLPLPKPSDRSWLALHAPHTAEPGDTPLALTPAASNGSPTCADPFKVASAVKPVMPQYPAIASQLHQSGTALVRVDVAGDGTVANTSIFESSGYKSLDAAAVEAAAASSYSPAIFRCNPIASSYIFTAQFKMN